MRAILFLLLLAGGAWATPVTYKFDYSPGSGPIQAFNFEFTSPDFVGIGQISITPFTVTDGTTVWTMTRGVAGVNLVSSCFQFATATNSGVFSDCSGSLGPPDGGVFLVSFTNPPAPPPPLPIADGTYTTSFATLIAYNGIASTNSTGTVTLTVTSVPEPSAFLMVMFGCITSLALGRFRLRTGTPCGSGPDAFDANALPVKPGYTAS